MSFAAQPIRPLSREEALAAVHAGATLVAGNDRLARSLRLAYNAQRRAAGETAWGSPHIHSWPVWIDRLWRGLVYRSAEPLPARLTAAQERCLWERIIRRQEADRRLLSVEATAEAARQAWRLRVEWRLDPAALRASEADDVRAFLRWSAELEQICAAEGWIDGARAVDRLAASGELADEAPLLLAGFDVYTPQQQALLTAFQRAGVAVREVVPAVAGASTARRVACESRREEVRAAARWARRLADEHPEARIGVIVPQLGQRRQEVERIFREAFDAPSLLLGDSAPDRFAIAAGLPLDRYPLVHAALLALDLHPGGTDLRDFGRFLRSPSFAGGEAERGERGLLDRRLRDKGVSTVTTWGLKGSLDRAPLLAKALKRWAGLFRRMPAAQTPAAWTDTFARLLGALGWPGDRPLGGEDLAVFEKWNELLAAFAELGATADPMTLDEARRTLSRMAAETRLQLPAGLAAVEVMDLFESAGAQVDYLWAAGLDDETWPSPPSPSPFLPAGLQREMRLPHGSAEAELRFARLETDRLLAAAPHVVLSHARAVEDRELDVSPLIAEIPEAALAEISPAGDPAFIDRMHASRRLETVVDHAAPPIGPEEPALGGARIFEYQAHCPFRAFAQLRLGAQPLREVDPGLAAWERGHLVHDSMEYVWSELQSSGELRRRSGEELLDLAERAADRALDTLVKKRREPLPARFQQVERQRLRELLLAWLEIEKEHRAEAFRAVELEQRTEIVIRGISAKVRLDRVDELEDGRRVVVDYKTGKTNPKEWDHERPIEPQLPLYAVSQQQTLDGALFARLRAIDSGFQGAVGPGITIRGADHRRAADFDGRVTQWRMNLEALADEFLAGRAAVDPRDRKCGYCELPALCRKDETR